MSSVRAALSVIVATICMVITWLLLLLAVVPVSSELDVPHAVIKQQLTDCSVNSAAASGSVCQYHFGF